MNGPGYTGRPESQAVTRAGGTERSARRLRRLDLPDTTTTSLGWTLRAEAIRSQTSRLARPASGGAATRSLTASPWRPTTPGWRAPGWTWTHRRTVPSEVTVIGEGLTTTNSERPAKRERPARHKR